MAQKKNISQNNSSANESVLDVRQKETSMLKLLLPILLLTFFAYLPIFNADFV